MSSYSEFHDGSFDGIWIDDATVHLYMRTWDKKPFVVVAEGVTALNASGFRRGNIVFEMATRDADELTSDDIQGLYELRDGEVGQSQTVKLLGKARQERLSVLDVSSSYGASCSLLARSITVIERAEWLRRYLGQGRNCGR